MKVKAWVGLNFKKRLLEEQGIIYIYKTRHLARFNTLSSVRVAPCTITIDTGKRKGVRK